MFYEERAAPPGYERLITRLWYLDVLRTARYEKILPLPWGHLVVNLSAPYRLIDASGRATRVEGAFVAGLRTHYLISELPRRLRHVGAEFTPTGLDALTAARGVGRAGTLTGGRVLAAAGILDGAGGLSALMTDLTPAAALDGLTAFLAGGPAPSPDPVAAAAAEALQRDPGTAVADLARQAGVSRGILSTRFRQATGLTPKSYALVCRFHRLVADAQAGASPDWAALAVDSGYYDQPHVIRAFHRFSGWTPAEYHRRIAAFGPAEAFFVPLSELPTRSGQARS